MEKRKKEIKKEEERRNSSHSFITWRRPRPHPRPTRCRPRSGRPGTAYIPLFTLFPFFITRCFSATPGLSNHRLTCGLVHLCHLAMTHLEVLSSSSLHSSFSHFSPSCGRLCSLSVCLSLQESKLFQKCTQG